MQSLRSFFNCSLFDLSENASKDFTFFLGVTTKNEGFFSFFSNNFWIRSEKIPTSFVDRGYEPLPCCNWISFFESNCRSLARRSKINGSLICLAWSLPEKIYVLLPWNIFPHLINQALNSFCTAKNLNTEHLLLG